MVLGGQRERHLERERIRIVVLPAQPAGKQVFRFFKGFLIKERVMENLVHHMHDFMDVIGILDALGPNVLKADVERHLLAIAGQSVGNFHSVRVVEGDRQLLLRVEIGRFRLQHKN